MADSGFTGDLKKIIFVHDKELGFAVFKIAGITSHAGNFFTWL
jgi:hypothetical protein